MKITCFGSGIFSLAIALELAKQKKNHIIIWTPDEKWLKEVNKTNTFVINDEKYPQKDNITITTSYEEALKDTSAIFLLTASIYLKSVILEIKKYYKPNTPIFNASKGLIDTKPYYASRFIKNTLKTKKTAFLAGPNFAHDLLKDAVTTITVGTKDKQNYQLLKTIFPKNIKLEYLKDEKALELASVLKNIYAIGSGMIYKNSPYKSTIFAYLTESYNEFLEILYEECNYPNEKLYSGTLGDFFLTCSETESRNFTYGRLLIQTKKEANLFLKQNTVEGYNNLLNLTKFIKIKKYPILYEIAKKVL